MKLKYFIKENQIGGSIFSQSANSDTCTEKEVYIVRSTKIAKLFDELNNKSKIKKSTSVVEINGHMPQIINLDVDGEKNDILNLKKICIIPRLPIDVSPPPRKINKHVYLIKDSNLKSNLEFLLKENVITKSVNKIKFCEEDTQNLTEFSYLYSFEYKNADVNISQLHKQDYSQITSNSNDISPYFFDITTNHYDWEPNKFLIYGIKISQDSGENTPHSGENTPHSGENTPLREFDTFSMFLKYNLVFAREYKAPSNEPRRRSGTESESLFQDTMRFADLCNQLGDRKSINVNKIFEQFLIYCRNNLRYIHNSYINYSFGNDKIKNNMKSEYYNNMHFTLLAAANYSYYCIYFIHQQLDSSRTLENIRNFTTKKGKAHAPLNFDILMCLCIGLNYKLNDLNVIESITNFDINYKLPNIFMGDLGRNLIIHITLLILTEFKTKIYDPNISQITDTYWHLVKELLSAISKKNLLSLKDFSETFDSSTNTAHSNTILHNHFDLIWNAFWPNIENNKKLKGLFDEFIKYQENNQSTTSPNLNQQGGAGDEFNYPKIFNTLLQKSLDDIDYDNLSFLSENSNNSFEDYLKSLDPEMISDRKKKINSILEDKVALGLEDYANMYSASIAAFLYNYNEKKLYGELTTEHKVILISLYYIAEYFEEMTNSSIIQCDIFCYHMKRLMNNTLCPANFRNLEQTLFLYTLTNPIKKQKNDLIDMICNNILFKENISSLYFYIDDIYKKIIYISPYYIAQKTVDHYIKGYEFTDYYINTIWSKYVYTSHNDGSYTPCSIIIDILKNMVGQSQSIRKDKVKDYLKPLLHKLTEKKIRAIVSSVTGEENPDNFKISVMNDFTLLDGYNQQSHRMRFINEYGYYDTHRYDSGSRDRIFQNNIHTCFNKIDLTWPKLESFFYPEYCISNENELLKTNLWGFPAYITENTKFLNNYNVDLKCKFAYSSYESNKIESIYKIMCYQYRYNAIMLFLKHNEKSNIVSVFFSNPNYTYADLNEVEDSELSNYTKIADITIESIISSVEYLKYSLALSVLTLANIDVDGSDENLLEITRTHTIKYLLRVASLNLSDDIDTIFEIFSRNNYRNITESELKQFESGVSISPASGVSISPAMKEIIVRKFGIQQSGGANNIYHDGNISYNLRPMTAGAENIIDNTRHNVLDNTRHNVIKELLKEDKYTDQYTKELDLTQIRSNYELVEDKIKTIFDEIREIFNFGIIIEKLNSEDLEERIGSGNYYNDISRIFNNKYLQEIKNKVNEKFNGSRNYLPKLNDEELTHIAMPIAKYMFYYTIKYYVQSVGRSVPNPLTSCDIFQFYLKDILENDFDSLDDFINELQYNGGRLPSNRSEKLDKIIYKCSSYFSLSKINNLMLDIKSKTLHKIFTNNYEPVTVTEYNSRLVLVKNSIPYAGSSTSDQVSFYSEYTADRIDYGGLSLDTIGKLAGNIKKLWIVNNKREYEFTIGTGSESKKITTTLININKFSNNDFLPDKKSSSDLHNLSTMTAGSSMNTVSPQISKIRTVEWNGFNDLYANILANFICKQLVID